MNNIIEESMKTIKKIFTEREPNIIYGFDNSIPSYNYMIGLWKKYIKGGNIILPDKYYKIIIEVFKFHLNKVDHVILFQSYNLDNSLLMCRIKEKFFNVIVPKVHFKDTVSLISVYTN